MLNTLLVWWALWCVPFSNEGLIPPAAGSASQDNPRLSALSGDYLGWRKLLCSKSCLSLGTDHIHNWSTWRKKASSLLPNLGPLCMSIQPQSFHKIGWGLCWDCITAQFLPLLPASFSFFSQVLIPRALSKKNVLHVNLCQSLLPGGTQPTTFRMKGNENCNEETCFFVCLFFFSPCMSLAQLKMTKNIPCECGEASSLNYYW